MLKKYLMFSEPLIENKYPDYSQHCITASLLTLFTFLTGGYYYQPVSSFYKNTGDHPRTTLSKNRRGGWKAGEYLYKFNRNPKSVSAM